MPDPYQSDFIGESRREGYLDVPRKPTYLAVGTRANKPARTHWLSIAAEERIGSLVAAAGTIWATYTATVDYANLWRMQIMPPGPVEICALGILAWLHAKWRRSTKVN